MLTQEQIERYDRNGYIGVENVLSSEEIEELRKVTDDFVEKSGRLAKAMRCSTWSPATAQSIPSYVGLNRQSIFMMFTGRH